MLRPEQLPNQLRRGLAPVYLLAGDEPLLVQEMADQVRARAREAGAEEREVLQVDSGFDWGRLGESGGTLSLFASLRLIEVRLEDAKPGDAGSRALVRYAKQPPDDVILLVIAGRLDRKARNSAWFKALDKAGQAAYAWPIGAGQWPQWVTGRCRARGLNPDREAIEVLCARTDGNLLACAQEIEKLGLLYPDGRIDRARVLESVADHARFDVFDLPDRVLAGRAGEAVRRLARLREEGVEPVLVLWALTRDLRLLAHAAALRERGAGLDQAFKDAGIWSFRQPAFRAALSRIDRARAERALARAAAVECVVKGAREGQPWAELLELCCLAVGRPLTRAVPDEITV